MDTTDFTVDDATPLLSCIPMEEEMQQVKRAVAANELFLTTENPLSFPTTAEAFVYIFSQMPRDFRHVMQTFVFRLKVFDELHRIRQLIDQICQQLVQLRQSHLVRILLKTVLKVAQLSTVEYGPSSRMMKSIQGFRLEALLCLKDVKSKDGKSTLMHYIAHLLNRQYPDVLQLPVQFESLGSLQNLHLNEWKQSLMKLQTECDELKTKIVSHSSSDKKLSKNNSSDKGRREFLQQASQLIEETVRLWEAMYEEWRKTAEFFGEDVNQSIDSFFRIFHESLSSLKWAHAQNQEREVKTSLPSTSISPPADVSTVSTLPSEPITPPDTLSVDLASNWQCQECHGGFFECNCAF
jgi:hypothetical protein